MNYSKKSIRKKKKALRSSSRKWGKKFTLTFFKVFLLVILTAGVLSVCLGFGVFKGILESAPDVSNIDISPTGFSTFVYDNAGNQIGKLIQSGSNRIPVTFDQVPEDLSNAFVAIEDERFYTHNGIDIKGIIRAAVKGLTTGHFSEGASTLTQQVIKNNVLTSWTSENSFSESLKRKIQEQYLALEVEKMYKEKYGEQTAKEKILENYMNTINLGQNTLGVQAASKRYFNKNVWELNLSECAVIAGITQNPSRYNPITHPEDNAERREKVLRNMQEQGYITESEYQEALADDVYTRIQEANETIESESSGSVNSYYLDAVQEQVLDDLIYVAGYTETQANILLYSGGLKIYSAQDSAIQEICDEVCTNEENFPENTRWQLNYALTVKKADGTTENHSSEMLRSYMRENKDTNFNLLYDTQDEAYAGIEEYKAAVVGEGDEILGEKVSLVPQPQISLVISDQATGYVVAMVGGRGAKEGNRTLNRATSSLRQPGSTFKIPAVYAPALDSAGYTLATAILDEPYNYADGKPVKNYYSGYKGILSVREGIVDSVNILAVKTLTQITPQLGFDYLQKFGFTTVVESKEINGKIYSDIQQPLALGGITDGVKNIELNAAYAAIANQGRYNKPKLYTKVVDHEGNVLLDNTTVPSEQIIKETTAFLLTDAMTDVVTRGTGTAVNFGNMTIAGKSGTTSDYNDIWFAGYTPYYTCTTWAGYDNNTKLSRGAERQLAKTIWRAAMSKIHANLENKSFPVPAGIVTATVCSQSGKIPIPGLCDAYQKTEYFDSGTVPVESCDVHYSGIICAYSQKPATDSCPFKVTGTLTLPPSTSPGTTTTLNPDGTVATGGAEKCPHDETFWADPNAQAIVEQQRLEMQVANAQSQYAEQLNALQTELQNAQATKAAADAQYAQAQDDASRESALQISQTAQQQIDSLTQQIQTIQAAIAAGTAPAAADAAAGSDDAWENEG